MLPPWLVKTKLAVDAVVPPIASVAPSSELSPVFGRLVRKFDTFKARYDKAANRYEALDEDIRNLRFSRNEADIDRYGSYEVVREYHRAGAAFSSICLTAMWTHVQTTADCDAQEWLETVMQNLIPPYQVESHKRQCANNAYMRAVVRKHLQRDDVRPITAT